MSNTRPHWRVVVRPQLRAREKNYMAKILPPTGSGHAIQEWSTHTADFAKAQALARDKEQELNGVIVVRDGTWLEMWDAYVSFRSNGGLLEKDTHPWAPDTFNYAASIRKALAPHIGAAPMKSLDRHALNRLRDKLRETLQPSTVNSYLSVARTAWGWGQDRGFVSCDMPDIRRLRKQNTNKVPIPSALCEKILMGALGYVGGRWYSVLRFAYETGCRISEACELREGDVGRSRSIEVAGESHTSIRIDEVMWYPVRLNGRKVRREKVVYVSQEMLSLMPERATGDETVFRSFFGKALNRHSVKAAFYRICRREGISREGIDVHSFRRSWSKDAVRTPGLNPEVSKKFLGHAQLQTFLKYQEKAQDPMAPVAAAVSAHRASQVASRIGGSDDVNPDGAGPKTSSPGATRPESRTSQVETPVRVSPKPPSSECSDETRDTATPAGEGNRLTQLVAALSEDERKELLRLLERTPKTGGK